MARLTIYIILILTADAAASAGFNCASAPKALTESMGLYRTAPDYTISDSRLYSHFKLFDDYRASCPAKASEILRSNGFSSAQDMRDRLTERLYGDLISIDGVKEVHVGAEPPVREIEMKSAVDLGASAATQEKIWQRWQSQFESNRKNEAAIQNLDPSSCTAKDLRGKLMPARFQSKSSKLCASHAVADLMTIELGQPVSAMSLAVGLNAFSVDYKHLAGIGFSPNDGDVAAAMKAGKQLYEPLTTSMRLSGFCLESEIRSGVASPLPELSPEGTTDEELLNALKDAGKPGAIQERACTLTGDRLRMLLPTLSPGDLGAVVKSAEGNLMLSEFNKCKQRLPAGALEKMQFTRFRLNANQKEKQLLVDGILNSDGIVASIIPFELYEDPAKAGNPPQHAISVVARRPNPKTGKCEYLIRDSIGAPEKLAPVFTREDANHTWAPADVLFDSLPQMLHHRLN